MSSKIYKEIIKIPKVEIKSMQNFLETKGFDRVGIVKIYTADFGDKGEGVIQVDIKVCEGNPPFVDAVIFQDNSEIGCCEVREKLLGEYIFQSILKDTYTVILVEN